MQCLVFRALLTERSLRKSLNLLLLPVTSKPTRISDTRASLIDYFLVNNPTQTLSGVILTDLSDHLPIFVIYDSYFKGSTSENITHQVSFRLTNEDTLNKLYSMLDSYDFSNLLDDDDVNGSVSQLTNIINNCYNICCPMRTKTISHKSKLKPWITNEIISNIKLRNSYAVLYRQGKIPRDYYHRFRNYVTTQIRKSKKDYFARKFSECEGNIKKTWSLINGLIRPGVTRGKTIRELVVDGLTYDTDKDIANIFNDFFC